MKLNHSYESLRESYSSLNKDMIPMETVGKIMIEEINCSAMTQKIAESIVKRFESELGINNVQAWALLCKRLGII